MEEQATQTTGVVRPLSSNGGSASDNGPSTRDPAGKHIAARGSERMPGVILTVQSGLFADGREFARSSGITVAREEDLKVLREHAEAIGNDVARPVYDPNTLAQDRVIENQHEKDLRDRDEEELGLKRSHVNLAERRDEAARTGAKVPPAPKEPSSLLKVAGVVALATTIAVSLHDFVWIMTDEFLSWSMSIVTASIFGVLITLLILSDTNHTGRRSVTNWIGLIAGIGVGVAFFLLRIKGAEGTEQVLFGLAMSALEVAIVLFLEGLAMSRRAALRNRMPLETAATEAEALVETQEAEVNRRNRNVAELNSKIDAHSRYVEERYVRATYLNEIRETARKAVESGYHQGIAENRGIVAGVRHE
jgi:hypothetical protein